jgi:hypothetical protein
MAFGFNTPPAYMGFVGFVRLKNTGGIEGNSDNAGSIVTHGDYLIRATSADINLTQEISMPDVVDSRYDRSVYQLGPKLVDGSVAFPVVYEVPTGEDKTIFEILYRYAATRKNNGNLSTFDVEVKYASSNTVPNEAEFVYKNCIVNTWQFAVSQSDVVTCTFDLIGLERQAKSGQLLPPGRSDSLCTDANTGNNSNDEIGTTRIVTWNDARVELAGGRIDPGGTGVTIGGEYVRSFEANINNDAERFYTLNTNLFAQAIAPRKREISGNLVLMGRHATLGSVAFTNQDQCTESGEVKFGYNTSPSGEGCGATSGFNTTFPNSVYEIETMSLTNDLFETTVNWYSLPSAGTGTCDPLLSSLNDTEFSYETQQSL